MFRHVPACSGMFHVPGFIDGRLVISNAKVNRCNVHVQHTFLHIVVRADDSLRTKIWALSIHPKLKKLWKQRQLVQYFPGKFPRLPETFPKCEPFNQKHSGANLNAERKLPDDNFRKFGYILRKCCSIRYCMEVAENLNQTF